MKAFPVITLLLLHVIVVALSISVVPPMISDRRVPIHCGIFENRELLSVVERICDLCHETYYEVYPRMGSDCRYVGTVRKRTECTVKLIHVLQVAVLRQRAVQALLQPVSNT